MKSFIMKWVENRRSYNERKHRIFKRIKIIIGIIVALVVIAAGAAVFYMVGIGAASSTSTPEIIEVSSGDTATAVLAKMEKKGP